MPTFKSNKKGGEGTLNSHIENYIKAEKEGNQKAMNQHKTLYMNAYARHMGVPKMIEQKLAFGLMPSRNVINPKIQASFDKRVKDEKNAQEDANKLEQKRQEEIIRRNLEKDKMKQMNKKNREKSGAFDENVTPQTKKAASDRFIQMRLEQQQRGPSTLRKQTEGGKRKTRKHRKKKTRKTKSWCRQWCCKCDNTKKCKTWKCKCKRKTRNKKGGSYGELSESTLKKMASYARREKKRRAKLIKLRHAKGLTRRGKPKRKN